MTEFKEKLCIKHNMKCKPWPRAIKNYLHCIFEEMVYNIGFQTCFLRRPQQ